jgi:hypothetical protein
MEECTSFFELDSNSIKDSLFIFLSVKFYLLLI